MIAAAQAIDPLTGTYTVEASFPNPDKLLLPGQFARVQAPYQTLKNVVTVPRKAIVELQGRFRVYVVNDANEVEMRDVELGSGQATSTSSSKSGLEGGELVIVEGLAEGPAGHGGESDRSRASGRSQADERNLMAAVFHSTGRSSRWFSRSSS